MKGFRFLVGNLVNKSSDPHNEAHTLQLKWPIPPNICASQFGRELELARAWKVGTEHQGGKPYPSPKHLEAQQRYFSYRAILVAIVSQNPFVLVFMGYRTIIARYVAKWGIAQMCLCESEYQGGVSHHSGEALTSLKKYRAILGIAAIVSQYRAIWGH